MLKQQRVSVKDAQRGLEIFQAIPIRYYAIDLNNALAIAHSMNLYAYDAYLKYLKANGIEHTAAVETTMKFDSKTNYPKVLFKYSGILEVDKMKVAAERTDSDEVMKILHIEIKSPEHKAQEAVEAEFVEDTAAKEAAEKAAKAESEKAAKAEKAKKAKEAKAKKAAEEAKKKEEVAQPVEAESDDELGDILSDWS